MSRVSYENGRMVIIIEGLSRGSFYYNEPNLCTINTDHTISTLVGRNIQKKPVNDNSDLGGIVFVIPAFLKYRSNRELYP